MSRRTAPEKRSRLEVSPAIYGGTTRDERREIARAWVVFRAARQAGVGEAIPSHWYACAHCHKRISASGICPCVASKQPSIVFARS